MSSPGEGQGSAPGSEGGNANPEVPADPGGDYSDASPAEAKDLFERKFPEVRTNLEQDPARQIEDEEVERFYSDFTARIARGPGRDEQLAVSSTPLRVAGEPVDLSLIAEGAGSYQPENPVIPVRFPASLEEGLAVGNLGVDPVNATPVEASRVGDDQLFYAEAWTDSDLIATATSGGIEIFTQLRSPQAPTLQELEFQLPDGASLRSTPDGGAEVTTAAGAIGRVLPPHAEDANGDPVPVTMSVVGPRLRLAVDVQQSTPIFPILVDPLIENWQLDTNGNPTESWYYGFNAEGLNAWSWTYEGVGSNDYAPRHDCADATGLSCHGDEDLLYIYGRPNFPYPAGSYGQWTYIVPGEKSFVSEASFGPLFLGGANSSEHRLMAFLGLWSPVARQHAAWRDWGGTVNLSNTFVTLDPGPATDARWVTAGLGGGLAGAFMSGWRDFAVGGAVLYLDDSDVPELSVELSTNGLPGLPNRWVDAVGIHVAAQGSDEGLGVKEFKVRGPGIGGDGEVVRTHNCTGGRQSPCPNDGLPFSAEGLGTAGESLTISTSPIPEGIQTLSATVADVVDHVSPQQSWQVKVDHDPPDLQLGGGLYEHRCADSQDAPVADCPPAEALQHGAYRLESVARDSHAGVKKIEVLIDGKREYLLENPCDSTSGCPAEVLGDYHLYTAAQAPGIHKAVVRTTDPLDHVTAESFQFRTDYSADCPRVFLDRGYNLSQIDYRSYGRCSEWPLSTGGNRADTFEGECTLGGTLESVGQGACSGFLNGSATSGEPAMLRLDTYPCAWSSIQTVSGAGVLEFSRSTSHASDDVAISVNYNSYGLGTSNGAGQPFQLWGRNGGDAIGSFSSTQLLGEAPCSGTAQWRFNFQTLTGLHDDF